jgi:hypothetical protein
MFFAVGDIGIGGQIAVMVKQQVQFDSTFCPAEFRPGEQGKTQ